MVSIAEHIVSGQGLLDASGHVGPLPCEFGVRGTAGTSVGLTDQILGRHVLFLGGIGTGKSVGMHSLVKSIRAGIGPDDVLVFFDTKRDYLEAFGKAGDVVVGDSPGLSPAQHVVWNVFEEFRCAPGDRDAEDEIYEVSNGLFANLLQNSGDNVYFVSAARDLLVALLAATLRENGQRTNADIRHGIARMSVSEMHELLDRAGNEDLRGSKHYIAREGSPSTGAVIAFMQQVIQESFRSSFGHAGGFSIRRFLRDKGGRALFFEYDIAAGSLIGPVYKTMLDLAMKEAMSRTRAAGRVFFVLDEFALLPELAHLTNGLNFGRSLGLRFVVGTQNIKQVETMYGPETAMSVLSAFGTVFSFRLFDGPSRDFVRDRFGHNKKILRFDQFVRAKGLNESVIDGYVVEDWDLSALPVGTCIAATPDMAPVRFTFAPT